MAGGADVACERAARRPALSDPVHTAPRAPPSANTLDATASSDDGGVMRVLVLGGSVFLSREVAAQAVARGHDVVCANRGRSGSVPEGAAHVVWDRAEAPPAALVEAGFDAVVDVARQPSHVATALAIAPEAHWSFVSTVNVYADEVTPGQTPATAALVEPEPADHDLAEHPDAYGRMKVACENLVRAGARAAFVVRPGLIVGPGDPTGRFTYWPARLARVQQAPRVLAGGAPSDHVQVIDVRDLAAWIVHAFETGLVGDFDGVGEVLPVGSLLASAAAGIGGGVGVEPEWVWADAEALEQAEVAPWAGPRSLPLWLPRPAYDGMMGHDPAPSIAAGLRLRPIAETTADTLAWLRATPGASVTGLSAAEEAEVLKGLQDASPADQHAGTGTL